jgi:hypothetical protein
MIKTILLVASVLALIESALAQDVTAVLLPVTANTPIPGANGSLWSTEIVARNNGPDAVFFLSPCSATSVCLPPYRQIQPHTTVRLENDSPRGTIILLRSREAAAMVFDIRARDLSRQSETWGTEIPAIADSAAFTSTSTLYLLNIPTTSAFRSFLRIYDFVESLQEVTRQFNVKVFPLSGDTLLKEMNVTTTTLPGQAVGEVDVSDVTPPAGGDTVRLEITPFPVDPPRKFWAFVSVTNNATQHVTLVTPQPQGQSH